MSGASVRELESLYRGRFGHFVRVATALLRDEEQAVDAVHDAFVTAIRQRRAFRGEGPLEAWVWRIVVNAARKTLAERPQPQPTEPASAEEKQRGFAAAYSSSRSRAITCDPGANSRSCAASTAKGTAFSGRGCLPRAP